MYSKARMQISIASCTRVDIEYIICCSRAALPPKKLIGLGKDLYCVRQKIFTWPFIDVFRQDIPEESSWWTNYSASCNPIAFN